MHVSLTTTLLGELLARSPAPAGFCPVAETIVRHNQRRAVLLRCQGPEARGIALGAAHVSLVTDAAGGQLLGFTNLTPRTAALAPAGNAAAQAAAAAFVDRFAPDLAGDLHLLWVAPHGETAGGQQIAGTKVKFRQRSSGLYAWMVVAGQDEVITFERDVVWNDDLSRRETQQWLHDAWLTTQTGGTREEAPITVRR